ncbi:MAG: hypothetical protein J5927_00790 [Oscillospiraceae bacterium]|nr:hypothetical protein [Oscillospiraceae bacterium]
MYDICILSVKDDAAIAEALAASIRGYQLPARTAPAEPGLDYRRLLVDTDGAPFTEKTARQLEDCRYLVLLCSPETRNDPTILEKLACFRRARGAENVVAVIAKGEPAESFPESFIEKKVVQHILPDMTVVERVETIEPVAADLRAESRARWKEVLRYETVRIVASVLGLHPDALEQRHRQRRKKAVAAVLSVVGAVCLAAAGIFLRLGFVAKTQGDIAQAQTQLSVDIARRTMEELPASFEGDEQALAYIQEAVEEARASLTELGLGELLDGEAGGST